MTGWRFLISRRWAGYLALTVVFAIVCVLLAMWQLARRDEAVAEINRVETNFDAEPTPLADVLPELDAYDPSQEWLTVSMTGRYLTDDQVLVRNRPLGGDVGFDVLVPFQLANGDVFVVDRGWVPTGQKQDVPDAVPAAPTGTVSVVARLKAGEPHLDSRGAVAGQIATIELPVIADQVGQPTYTSAYGLLASEDPAPAERPTAVAKPTPDEGAHLSYTFQWFCFGLLGFVGLGYIIRQEYRRVNEDDPEEQERAAERERKRLAKRTDAQVEDEILDSRSTPD
ncbi:SURF1 family cytochrome oxidase biogenesis protein [Herbiconiux daphne]|uniref:SURF1-like protein n=1 Tax=Herbiconiux daphne TaxID=2970914 RepID=A0ABT2GZD5_9MICO|nr:SURF1 family protein [Herbiconiux daphne]MCS5733329.1 SURF1 family protein [Herbiconiux daphne]